MSTPRAERDDAPRDNLVNLDILYGGTASECGETYLEHLLEQYKLYVEMADRISERRQSTNRFFLTVNTALIAFLGLVVGPNGAGAAGLAPDPPLAWALVVSAAGVMLCYSWYRLVGSYRNLNKVKFAVIKAMESKLPSSPYGAEAVGRTKDPDQYLPFTRVEINVPWVFAALYALLAIWNIIQSA